MSIFGKPPDPNRPPEPVAPGSGRSQDGQRSPMTGSSSGASISQKT